MAGDTPAHTLIGLPARTPTPSRARARRDEDTLEGRELLGRYGVERRIGRGGMGVVYVGRHLTIGRPVAIKVLAREYSDQPDPVARFLQEAQAASLIRHEHVIEITDFGTTEDGIVFFVMELLEGETLQQTLTRIGALPWPRARAMMLQICGALQAAHEAGVVHRDLKPDNCMRIRRGGSEDFVKVLDFGIAKVAQGPEEGRLTRRTRVGIVVGTPEYMAPEHARGAASDHRVDVYAAGVILFELATGRLPFHADSVAEMLAMHLQAPVPDPRDDAPALPLEVTRIVRRAMAKDPGERFANMRELAAAIEAVDDPVAAPPEPSRAPTRRRLAIAALLGAAALAGLAIAVPQRPAPMSVPTIVPLAPPPPSERPRAIEPPEPPEPPARQGPEQDVSSPATPASDAQRPVAPVTRSADPEPSATPMPTPRRRRVKRIPAAPLPIAESPSIDARVSEVKNPFAD